MMRPRRSGTYNIVYYYLPVYLPTIARLPAPSFLYTTVTHCVLRPYPRHVACDPRRTTTTTLFYLNTCWCVAARLTFVFRPCFQLRLARCTTGVYCPPGPYGWAPSSYPTTTINHCRRQVRLRARRRWDIHKYSITIIIHTWRVHDNIILRYNYTQYLRGALNCRRVGSRVRSTLRQHALYPEICFRPIFRNRTGCYRIISMWCCIISKPAGKTNWIWSEYTNIMNK